MTVDERDVAAVLDCLRSGWLTMGPRIRELETLLAERLEVDEVVVVSSGTAAVQLACLAAGVQPGDRVGTGADISPWTPDAIRAAGGVPFALGGSGDAPQVAVNGDAATVIEDQGESLRRPGGDLSCHSMSGASPLSVGIGGYVATRDAERAALMRSLRSHAMTSGSWDRHRGHAESYDVVDIGFNYRLDEPRAALALARLARAHLS